MISYYSKEKAIPMIIELLSKNGNSITEQNIKSWGRPKMQYSDVLRGINHVKSLNSNTIVFTNEVMLKERIAEENDITILDVSDLKELSIKFGNYDLYYMLELK